MKRLVSGGDLVGPALRTSASPREAGKEIEEEAGQAGDEGRTIIVGASEFKQAAMARMQALHESPLEYLTEKKMEISQISPAVKDVGWS